MPTLSRPKGKGLRPTTQADVNAAAGSSQDVDAKSSQGRKAASRKAESKAAAAGAQKKKSGAPAGGRRGAGPPKLTASFVMGVQRRPGTAAAAKKAKRLRDQEGAYAAMLKDAGTVEASTAAAAAARATALEAAAGARLAAKVAAKAAVHVKGEARVTGDKGLTRQQITKACGVVHRLAQARVALRETAAAETRARAAAERIARYKASWKAMIDTHGTTGAWIGADGKREVGDTLPVGHKLKQLLLTCGAQLSEEACGLIFAQLGGTGSSCDFDSFMRVVCEHGAGLPGGNPLSAPPPPTTPSRSRGLGSSLGSSPLGAGLSKLGSSTKRRLAGSPISPPKPIRWTQFRDMLVDDEALYQAALAAKEAAEAAERADRASGGGSSGGGSGGGGSGGSGGSGGGESSADGASDKAGGASDADFCLTDIEARLLFARCGGNEEAGTLSRADFDKAAAADVARRRRMGLQAADPALEC